MHLPVGWVDEPNHGPIGRPIGLENNHEPAMPIEWERIPDDCPILQALDGDETVGRVYHIPTRPERRRLQGVR